MFIKKFFNVLKPQKILQRATYEWFEQGRWMCEVIKCKDHKSKVYVKSGFDDYTNQFYLEWYE